MKKEIRAIIENIPMENMSRILLQYWGPAEDRVLLEELQALLHSKGKDTTCVVLNKSTFDQALNVDKDLVETIYGHKQVDDFELIVDFITFSPTSLVRHYEEEPKERFVTFMRGIFGSFTQEDKTFLQVRLPSEEVAEESGLTLEEYGQYWSQMVLVDYDRMRQAADDMIKEIAGTKSMRIDTGDCSLTFDIDDRAWHKDVGNGDFPAGEVYVAPIETSANGNFKVDKIIWEGKLLENLILTFEEGQLIATSEPSLLEDLKHAPGDALTFAEFGLGLNDGLKAATGYPLFDEKMKGSCHIAIGMNALFGGNTSNTPVHIDFVAKSYTLTKA